MMMFTGSAETPRETEISTSSKSPPIRIANATQSGLKQLCRHKKKERTYKKQNEPTE